jgi:hypothetical protein
MDDVLMHTSFLIRINSQLVSKPDGIMIVVVDNSFLSEYSRCFI